MKVICSGPFGRSSAEDVTAKLSASIGTLTSSAVPRTPSGPARITMIELALSACRVDVLVVVNVNVIVPSARL